MVARRHTLHDLDPQFDAGLQDDFVNTATHRPLQNLIVIFFSPNDLKPFGKIACEGTC